VPPEKTNCHLELWQKVNTIMKARMKKKQLHIQDKKLNIKGIYVNIMATLAYKIDQNECNNQIKPTNKQLLPMMKKNNY